MPGIVTHNRILKESILNLSKREKKSYLLKSIETLFNTPRHLTAGLFGSLGPNIFDYIPARNKHNYYGNDISFFIHNGGADKLLHAMIKTPSGPRHSARIFTVLYPILFPMPSFIHSYFIIPGFLTTTRRKKLFFSANKIFFFNITLIITCSITMKKQRISISA